MFIYDTFVIDDLYDEIEDLGELVARRRKRDFTVEVHHPSDWRPN